MRLFLLSCLVLSLTIVGCSDKKVQAPDSSNFKALDQKNNKTVDPMTVPNK
jgi:hypothetical protein